MKKKQNNKGTETKGLRTWIEIDRKAIATNLDIFRSLIKPNTKLMAVVKSNAYGHSLIDFAQEMQDLGADWLGVDSVVEGLALRKEGIKLPILILGFTLPERVEEAIREDISLAISSYEQLQVLTNLKVSKKPRIHIKVDTGMHRQGFLAKDLPKILAKLKAGSEKFQVEGLFTHFAAAKNPAFPEYTAKQIAEFKAWKKALEDAGFSFLTHAAATAGAMLFPEAHFDMVRIGIGLYGLWPSKEARSLLEKKLKLIPALSWHTIISEVKLLPKGSKIGYDCVETLERESLVGVCPIGYWHGFPRALSSIGHVLVSGKRCRVLGRVSMDMITIDLSGVPRAKPRDEVVLVGNQGSEHVSLYELGDLTDSSWYELVTRLNPLIKRIYR